MNYWAIYDKASGALIAIALGYSPDTLPASAAVKSLGQGEPDLARYQWDPSRLALVPRSPERVIARPVFIGRFTADEQRDFFGFVYDAAATAAQRKRVAAFERLLVLLDAVNLDDANVVAGVQYLESLGVLQAGRAAVILS